MSFREKLRGFFSQKKTDSVAWAAINAFSAASDAFDTALEAIDPYTTRANHQNTIRSAQRAIEKNQSIDPATLRAYQEVIEAYTDPADFEPYTEAFLDAHTAAIDDLSSAFDAFTVAFAAMKPSDNLDGDSANLFEATCKVFTFAANAYSNAVDSAKGTALEGKLQAAKDAYKIRCLERQAAHSNEANSAAATKAKAAAFKAKANDDETKAEMLDLKADIAQTKANALLATAKSAEARAKKVIGAARFPGPSWFLWLKGKPEGPYTVIEVREMWEAASVPREALVKSGGGTWLPLEDVMLELAMSELKQEAEAG